MLEEITKWYWEYGCKRGYDPEDPENEDRKITLGYWLDPVLRIFDRNQAIKAHANQKPCLALWGPSQ